MKKKLVLAGLMSSAVLLAACGGGGDGSSGSATSGNATGSTSQTTSTSSFACTDGYKKLTISNSSVIANANINLTTDDGIATLTLKTPASGLTGDLTVCLGKMDPSSAGATGDYIYGVEVPQGSLHSMASATLTLNFTTNVTPSPNPPVIELADHSNGPTVYKPLVQGASYVNQPNYSLSVSAQDAGIYVVRLKH
ncbi:lipoprotein [Burkholderia pseudomallei]|nr:hypothetical protein X993_676 [Burkholderia pseudomallei K42]AIV84526.1 hypothetical protein X978_3343 [Burkholderia pseudomallei MSHR3965]KGC27157.1 hypothetical protein DO73_1020 [Burkholderia pseudomallei]KGS39758.1 hypothetical protein X961_5667 [Burkholderia pseudomallei MSHR5613]KGV15803.1 hypothetical protein X881_706 [Burkholderia pseudomallei MSHR4300]KGV82926.1 hypothetical protein X887_2275 [Burkholderia pseudomallei MSHR4375]KGW11884.1 hypothetical protein X980_2965 [Burkholder